METIFFLVTSAADYNNGMIRDDFIGFGTGNVFADTTMWTVIALFLLTLIYYYLINGFSNGFNGLFKFNYMWSWLLTLIVGGVIGFFISYYQVGTFVYREVNGELPPIGIAGQRFILMCVIYSLIIFTLFSFIFKRWSKYAKFIPR
jgi:hypothetical protein